MKKVTLIIASVLVSVGLCFAQVSNTASHQVGINVGDPVLVDIETTGSSNDITLNVPTEAGEGNSFENASNSELWLNYSSIVEKNKTRSI